MWASDTFGNYDAFVEFNDDGNLTMYSPGRTRQIWQSGAWERPAQQSDESTKYKTYTPDPPRTRKNDPYCKKRYPYNNCIQSV